MKNYFAKLVSGENRQYLNWVWNYKKIFLLVPLAIALVWAYRHFGIFDYADKGLDIGAWEVFFNIFGTVLKTNSPNKMKETIVLSTTSTLIDFSKNLKKKFRVKKPK